jgi:hypothetical protein
LVTRGVLARLLEWRLLTPAQRAGRPHTPVLIECNWRSE